MEAIICNDINGDKGLHEYEELDNQIWTWLKEHQGAHGTHWADPVIHPNTSSEWDGHYAIPVDLPRMGGSLTPQQTIRVTTLSADWFPEVPVVE